MQSSVERHAQWLAAMRPAMPEAWQRVIDAVVRSAEEVRRALGGGLGRAVYAVALEHELRLRGLAVERDRPVRLRYKGLDLPEQHLELVVNGLVAVEVRAGAEINEVHAEHLDGLIRAADLPLALLVNFDGALIRNSVYRRFNRVATAALPLVGALPADEGENEGL
jgi:iron complex transport system substrate-binding protein